MHKNYKKLPPFLTAALCAMLLCSCAPALRAPQPTTAVAIGENSVIPDSVKIGKNTAIAGVTTKEDRESVV